MDLIRLVATLLVGLFLAWVGLWVLYFALEWAKPRQGVRAALMESTERQLQLTGGVLGAGAFVLLGLDELFAMGGQFVASHPLGVSSSVTISLGALGLSGAVQLTAGMFIFAALAVVALVLVVQEARS